MLQQMRLKMKYLVLLTLLQMLLSALKQMRFKTKYLIILNEQLLLLLLLMKTKCLMTVNISLL